jgi:hypothetical protein
MWLSTNIQLPNATSIAYLHHPVAPELPFCLSIHFDGHTLQQQPPIGTIKTIRPMQCMSNWLPWTWPVSTDHQQLAEATKQSSHGVILYHTQKPAWVLHFKHYILPP